MRLAVSAYSYVRPIQAGEMSLPDFVREAAALGLEGVELLDFFGEPDGLREAISETGLAVPIYSVSNNFVKPSAAERSAQVDRIRAGVDRALEYGASVVRVFGGDVAEGVPSADSNEWIIEGLSAGAEYASSHGVSLALENHGNLLARPDQVLGIIEAVGNSALGANPDTGNFMLSGSEPVESCRAVAPCAAMAHFKDIARADGEPQFQTAAGGYVGTALGEGECPLAACARELRSAGFNGWASIEYEGADGDVRGAVRRSVEFMRSLL